jgi:hypothetical protein
VGEAGEIGSEAGGEMQREDLMMALEIGLHVPVEMVMTRHGRLSGSDY